MNTPLCENLFEKLLNGTSAIEETYILDYFALKTAILIRDFRNEEALNYASLLHKFQERCSKKGEKWLEHFFFALTLCIENYALFFANTDGQLITDYLKGLGEVIRK